MNYYSCYTSIHDHIYACIVRFNPLSGNGIRCAYFNILLCLMPDDFKHHKESATTQWVNILVHTLS
jgi:hypothetical protein